MTATNPTKRSLPAMKLEFNEDKTQAYLTIFPPPVGNRVRLSEVMEFLNQNKLVGIDSQAIETALERKQFNQRILVASGFPPTKGLPAFFLYQFGINKNEGLLKTIPGQIIGVKIPPGTGRAGMTVFGDIIPGLLGDDIDMIASNRNIAVSKDGNKVYATIFGFVCWHKNRVAVGKTSSEVTMALTSNHVESKCLTIIDVKRFPASIVLKTPTEKEALKIGARILELAEDRLGLKREKTSSLFRVFELGLLGPWEDNWQDIDELLINQNGGFEFLNTDKGSYLCVTPAQGQGKRVKEEDVLSYLREKGCRRINEDDVRRVVSQASGELIKVGERQRNPEIDGYVKIEVASNYAKATMIVFPPKIGGCPALFVDAIDALREKGVISGIKQEAILEALSKMDNKPVVVAETIPPGQGCSAKIEYCFRRERKIELVEDENGRIDFKRLNLIENVHQGQILAIKIPADKGRPGYLVNGEEIPGLPGQDLNLPVGKNTEASADGLKLLSTADGQVLLAENNRVNVEDTIVIEGDVGLETGHIYFLGSVIIKGNVLDTFDVEAKGDIQVGGSVGKCFISAGGSIAIGEGVKGKDVARLLAKGDVFAKYIEHTRVEARGEVRVMQEIMHSQISANKSIILEGKKRGCIIGGLARAGEEVIAKEIGSVAGVKTLIEVGGEPKIRQDLAVLNQLYEADLIRRARLEKDRQVLAAKKVAEGRLLTDDILRYNRIVRQLNKLTVRLDRFLYKKDFLEAKLLMSEGGRVNVSGSIFAGVTVIVRTAKLEIKENYQAVSFGFEGEAVSILPSKMAAHS